MRFTTLIFLLTTALSLRAEDAVINVSAPSYKGQVVILYSYADLFTLRTIRITEALLDDNGKATLKAAVKGTAKIQLRIGDVYGDLYARPGSVYSITFPPLGSRAARSLNGTSRVGLEFAELPGLDVNAITTDLNDRIDAFIDEDLATDEVAGMQAVDIQRKQEPQHPDSVKRPSTLFITPNLSASRVDSFELKLRRFYRDVKDPWFARYFDHSIAGLRHGPRVNEKELYDRYLKGKPVVYDDPEYVRLLRSIYGDQMQLAQRFHEAQLAKAFSAERADSMCAVLARNDLLKNDPRLLELVMMDQLYQQYHGKVVQRAAAEKMLADVEATSVYPEHRTIAANILWDLTSMRVGSALPTLRLEDLNGKAVSMDSLFVGPICLAITATWCTYCEVEMAGLEQLRKEYKDVLPIVIIALDNDLNVVKNYRKAHPGLDVRWLHAVGEQRLRDELRLRSLPVFFLLNDGILARSPAPLPSAGLGAVFHQVREGSTKPTPIKVWDE